MGVSVDTSKCAAFVREFAATPNASAATLPKAAQKAGFEDRLVREVLLDFWNYLEKTHGGRRAVEKHISRPGFNLEKELESHTMQNKGRGLGDLFEAVEDLGMAFGSEGLKQARETTMSRNLTILSGEFRDFVDALWERIPDPAQRTLEALLAEVERAIAAPKEDTPNPAKLALLGAWIRTKQEARAPTEKELQWFFLDGDAFTLAYGSNLRAAALFGGNEASGLMLENARILYGMLEELGFSIGGKKRRTSLAVTEEEVRALEEDGIVPEHLMGSAAEALGESFAALPASRGASDDDLFRALGTKRTLTSFAAELRRALDRVWADHRTPDRVLAHLDAIAANESPDAMELMAPWQAQLAGRWMREQTDRQTAGRAPGREDIEEFLREPEAVQHYLRPDSFCSNFATAFCSYVVEMSNAILTGINELERSH